MTENANVFTVDFFFGENIIRNAKMLKGLEGYCSKPNFVYILCKCTTLLNPMRQNNLARIENCQLKYEICMFQLHNIYL